MSSKFIAQANGLKDLSTAIDTAFNSEPIKEKLIWLSDEHRHITETEFQQRKNDIKTERIEHHKNNRSKYKIDVNEVIPKPQIAISLANTKTDGFAILGTLGNFSVIIGKAKAKKSFFINIAVSTALSKDLILERFKSDLPNDKNEVLYFDTEQGKYHVQKAVKRICTQINQPEPENLHTYFLRSLTPSERLEFIENEIYSNDKIGFVVIDGIKDLVTSINDEEQATNIASKLLKWTEERNIHIITVLHQNKSDTNARGHIGTELINKAETVLEVAKSETDTNISIVTPQQCRNIEPEVFAFEINEFGIPIVAENFEVRTETKKNRFDVTDLEDFKKYQLLTEVFSKGESFSYGKLIEQLQIAYKNQFKIKLADNRTKLLITDCSNNGWLLHEKHGAPYTLGTFKENEI
jgi:predicted ATP-dependent serine protease